MTCTLIATVLAAIIGTQAAGQAAGLAEIGNRDAKEVAATSDFYLRTQ